MEPAHLPPPESALADWAASGAAWLTGPAGGPPDFSRAALLPHARAVAGEFTRYTDVSVDVPLVLTGRAALLGHTRRGRVSAGGATRLFRAADGWCALTLAREADIEVVPALAEAGEGGEPWGAVARWAAARTAAEVVERGVLLDLPVAALGEHPPDPPRVRRVGPAGAPRSPAGCLVADLTSLWAGPLCGRLLADAGATVVKVESPGRPDGTRRGDPAFFDWMHAGKLSYAVDFDRDTAALRDLLVAADVVLEGSRPGALARRGLGPELPGRPGRVWVRITGHGAASPRVGFGDDAAVAGGLVGVGPVFCLDAAADPLTGLAAAHAVTRSLARGGGELVELALAAVAAEYATLPRTDPRDTGACAAEPDTESAAAAPTLERGLAAPPVAPPVAPRITARASALGADSARVRALVAAR